MYIFTLVKSRNTRLPMCCLIYGMQRHKKFHSDLSKKIKDKNPNGKVNKSRNKVMGNNNINIHTFMYLSKCHVWKRRKFCPYASFIVLSAIDWTSVKNNLFCWFLCWHNNKSFTFINQIGWILTLVFFFPLASDIY